MIRSFVLGLILLLAQARPAATGSVRGRIQAQDGTPAAGVRVTAVASGDIDARQAGTLTSATLTDNTGRYRLDGIPPGRYFIAAGLIGAFTFLPGTTDESKATPVSVTANAVTENADFNLAASAGVRIRGVVGMVAGNFPKAREVTLTGLTPEPKLTAVQPDGSFEFRGVLPGTYTLEFAPTGQQVVITVGNTNIDDIKVKAPAVITGRIFVEEGGPVLTSPVQVGAASTQLMIVTVPVESSGLTYHQVPGNGTFAFTLSTAFTYKVEVYGLPFGYFVKSIRSGTSDLTTTALKLDDNPAVKNIDVVLTKQRPPTEPAGVTVRGRVTSNTAIPPGMQVTMTMTPPLSIAGTRIESDGSFIFHNVPPGPYGARVTSLGLVVSKSVVVGDTNIDDVALTVSLPVTLNGRVRLENATPASPRPALVVQFSRSDGFGRRLAINNGTFSASLLEGTYRVNISDIPARFVLVSAAYGSADASSSLTLDSTKPVEELVITLRDRETP
jgi:hypothetical protein